MPIFLSRKIFTHTLHKHAANVNIWYFLYFDFRMHFSAYVNTLPRCSILPNIFETHSNSLRQFLITCVQFASQVFFVMGRLDDIIFAAGVILLVGFWWTGNSSLLWEIAHSLHDSYHSAHLHARCRWRPHPGDSPTFKIIIFEFRRLCECPVLLLGCRCRMLIIKAYAFRDTFSTEVEKALAFTQPLPQAYFISYFLRISTALCTLMSYLRHAYFSSITVILLPFEIYFDAFAALYYHQWYAISPANCQGRLAFATAFDD